MMNDNDEGGKVRMKDDKKKLNYNRSEKVLSDTQSHLKNKAVKLQVQAESRRKVLTQGPREWNNSTAIEPPRDRTFLIGECDPKREIFNYRAEVLPEKNLNCMRKSGRQELDRKQLYPDMRTEDRGAGYIKRTQEMQVHPNLNDKDSWNFSTEVKATTRDELTKALVEKSVKKNKQQNERLLANGRKSLLEREKEHHQEIRRLKEAGEFDPRSNNADQHNNTTKATTHHEVLCDKTSTPSKTNKVETHYNDGTYEWSEIEQCKVWSCSMNPDPNFRGSNSKVKVVRRWNYASP